MSKVYLTNTAEGVLAITYLNVEDLDGVRLTKVLFELSRTTDKLTHFDPAIHTREVIAAGLDGHRPLSLLAECEDTDLPSDRYFRNAWEWED
jgi:hypothetical protein